MRPRILFVDDEPAVLRGLQRTLWDFEDEWGMRFCEGAQAALKAMEEEAPDVIITDHNMPGMTGLEFVQVVRLRNEWDNIQVVFLTGNNDQSLKRQALATGANDLLSKPVNTEDLLVRIKSCLNLKWAQDKLQYHNEMLEALVAERTKQLETAQFEIVYRLAKAAELRDEETGNHTLRVASCCRIIAANLGWESRFQEELFLASMLHDIGKVGIPDAILLKPGRLLPAEYDVMKQHSLIGASLLRQELVLPDHIREEFGIGDFGHSPILALAATVAEQHHERFDGTGYPKGLSGDQINMAARIVAVADVYDALRSERPYKAPFGEEQAMKIIEESSGTHFDPRVVSAFMACRAEISTIYERFSEPVVEDWHQAA